MLLLIILPMMVLAMLSCWFACFHISVTPNVLNYSEKLESPCIRAKCCFGCPDSPLVLSSSHYILRLSYLLLVCYLLVGIDPIAAIYAPVLVGSLSPLC
ncbi:hypothetical protein BJX70DRAFT_123702 [Aspergillus crustosus]